MEVIRGLRAGSRDGAAVCCYFRRQCWYCNAPITYTLAMMFYHHHHRPLLVAPWCVQKDGVVTTVQLPPSSKLPPRLIHSSSAPPDAFPVLGLEPVMLRQLPPRQPWSRPRARLTGSVRAWSCLHCTALRQKPVDILRVLGGSRQCCAFLSITTEYVRLQCSLGMGFA